MPASFDSDFAKWLTQHGHVRAQGVNVLEFNHRGDPPAFPTQWVSDYGDVFEGRTESGEDFVAQPLGFTFDAAADNLSTQQLVLIRMDNVNGRVTSLLRALTENDLQEQVVVTYRAYLDTKRNAPAYDALELFATNVRMVRLAVEVEVSADQMPNVTAGIRYTFDRFPPLVFL